MFIESDIRSFLTTNNAKDRNEHILSLQAKAAIVDCRLTYAIWTRRTTGHHAP
ncbi:MAG: hypothetical protein NC113_08505 [Bacteroides sp.]|nr:hypothetical protein [Bacteroides sp.]MCM1448238.1 hypothetical protein [Bacteroides sp.]MCM1516734.1 hypothetical protein [Paraprevotella sp.]